MNYSQIMSPVPLCLEKWGGGSWPPAPMGAPPLIVCCVDMLLWLCVCRSCNKELLTYLLTYNIMHMHICRLIASCRFPVTDHHTLVPIPSYSRHQNTQHSSPLSLSHVPPLPGLPGLPASHSSSSSSFSLTITPSLFHSRLKTYLFHKSFPP